MELSYSNTVDFTLEKTTLKLWKSPKQDVPQDILDELKAMSRSYLIGYVIRHDVSAN